MTTTKIKQNGDFPLRHAVATLAYRGAKAVRRAPEEFSKFRPAEGSRSAGEILAHIGDLLDWALSLAQGEKRWRNSKPQSWSEDTERFFAALAAFDEYLASGARLHAPPEKLFQGAIADGLTHVGQITMLRRLAGARVKG
ncbi:MAG: DinB family protein, partial [Blastocatellia bacterium]